MAGRRQRADRRVRDHDLTARHGELSLKHLRELSLDLLFTMAQQATAAGDSRVYLLSVLEMRAALGIDIVRLCTRRADQEAKDDLLAISEQMRQTADASDLFALEGRFWARLLDGAARFIEEIRASEQHRLQTCSQHVGPGHLRKRRARPGYRMPIARAVAAGDPESAERVARETLRPPVAALDALLMPAAQPPPAGRREKKAAASAPATPRKKKPT